MALHQADVDPTGEPGQLGDVHHADGDGLPVPAAVVVDEFDRVPEGVPVVEDLPQPRLPEVLGDDVGLDLDGPVHEFGDDVVVVAQGVPRVLLDEVEDDRVGDEPALDHLGQAGAQVRGREVEQNIMAVLEIIHRRPHRRRDRLEELLGDFSIGHLRGANAMALSGGERRRVEIARCLAANPGYLLLDEPFAGVDPIALADIRSLVHDLKERGIGVLITDHNVRETLGIVDRAYILHDGHVLKSGSTEDIIADPQVREVYLGDTFPMT